MDAVYLFNNGTNYRSYLLLGANPAVEDGMPGWRFSVWAPRAKAVSLVGEFNQWDADHTPMELLAESGIWTVFLAGDYAWQRYKYAIRNLNDQIVLKADPMARHSETRPQTASIVYPDDLYVWRDRQHMENRQDARANAPLNIYEMHMASWRRYPDGNTYNYRETAQQLAPYLVEMGFNAVELMPITEYPLDASWGYQVTGYFCPTSRYGSPADFKFFVDTMHLHGIKVILDWVPSHFPKDEYGLYHFDGTPTYEHPDPASANLQEWGTVAFDYAKKEVHSFLISSAYYWLDEYHIDGLRMDAISSMIYLTFDRPKELRNEWGGTDNPAAIDFLKHLNSTISGRFPHALLIAEESSAYPKITHKTADGGLGFTHKWNMGWMHDSLNYMDLDYIMRGGSYNKLTFSMTYAFSERYVLAFSHDEVVHGKRSLLGRMPGDLWRKFASLRVLLMYQMAHPGAKLNFMGYELGTFIEWRFYEELEWFMLQYERHCKLHDFVKYLNHFYLDHQAFWEEDDSWAGFEWMQADDAENAVFAFCRYSTDAKSMMLTVMNTTPAVLSRYSLRVPQGGKWMVRLNSDDSKWGGSNYLGDSFTGSKLETKALTTADLDASWVSAYLQNKPELMKRYTEARRRNEDAIIELPQIQRLELDLPPLAAIYLEYTADSNR